ncbi:hypothetical protein ACHAXH_008307 [Discostella pseudostelligera]
MGSRVYSSANSDPIIAAVLPQNNDVFAKGTQKLTRHDFDFEQLQKVGSETLQYSLASTLNVTHVQIEHINIKNIGHRGSPYTALENTGRSFLHAAQAGADGVELDVFLLKCGTLVVFHGSGDDTNPGLLYSYCGVEGSILDYTAEEARRLLTFNKHYDEFGCGPDEITHPDDDDTNNNHYCYIHTLEEVLATLRDHPDVKPEFTIKIELKGPATAAPTVELVRKLDMRHRCHYSSFDHSRIAEVRALDEDAITGALFGDNVPHNFSDIAISVGASEVHLKYDTATSERVRIAHRVGLNTMAWFRGPIGMKEDYLTRYFDVGNEDEEMYKTVLRSGVQSLCVNRPDVLAKALA